MILGRTAGRGLLKQNGDWPDRHVHHCAREPAATPSPARPRVRVRYAWNNTAFLLIFTPEWGAPKVEYRATCGGAHGAYGWDAIERLLDENLDLVAVSGARAGALNGAALARLWTSVARSSPLAARDLGWLPHPIVENWVRSSLVIGSYMAAAIPGIRDMSALRAIAMETTVMDDLGRPSAIPLHVAANRISDGSARIFANEEIIIEGKGPWNGDYYANSALGPMRRPEEINLHLVAAAPELSTRGAGSKSDTRWSTIQELRRMGHDTVDAGLAAHRDEIGRWATLRKPAREVA